MGWQEAEKIKEEALARAEVTEKENDLKQVVLERLKKEVKAFEVKEREFLDKIKTSETARAKAEANMVKVEKSLAQQRGANNKLNFELSLA